MQLKRTITRRLSEKQLKFLTKNVVIESKILQADGTYLVTFTRYLTGRYELIVNRLVKEKYSDSEEFAILRKSIKNPNNDEYLIYNAYVEDCKVRAREFVNERDSKLAKYNELELEV